MAINPLGEDHYRRLVAVQQSCCDTQEFLEKCRRCGLDVERAAQENEQQKKLAERIKAEFFPDRP